MRKPYQIAAGRAVRQVRQWAEEKNPAVQLMLPMVEVLFRFSVKWRRRVPPLVSVPPLRGGDFQGIGVYRSDMLWEERGRRTPAPQHIVSMSPPGYPSAWLHPCRASFRFAWQGHCS